MQWFSGCSGTSDDQPWGLVLVEAGLGVRLGPSHAHPSPAEEPETMGGFVAPKVYPGPTTGRV